MSHAHKDYLEQNMAAMRRVVVDRLDGSKRPTTILNGEGLALWCIIVANVQTNLLYMSLNSLSEATGMTKQNVRKRLAVFVQAGWLIERGFEKHGKYAATKTYEVVLDVLGVGQVTYPHSESHGTSQGESHGRSRSRSQGESPNTANPTQERESMPNPIPNTNPTPTVSESANNNGRTHHATNGGEKTRIDKIVALCIELELRHTKNARRPLLNIFQSEYSCLVAAELQQREWLTDEQTADVCHAKRNSKQPPTYTRPTCRACGGKNRDIEGLEGLSTVCNGGTYVLCPKCDGDGWQPLKELTRSMFTNLNTKGITQ